MRTTTYLGSGNASRHRRDYRPEWLDNLAHDVIGIVEGPGDLVTALREAEPEHKLDAYRNLGLNLTCDPDQRSLVHARD